MRRVLMALLVLTAAAAVAMLLRIEHVHRARAVTAARATVDDGVLRTVVVGDSVARGAGDERGDGIAGSLDRQLRAVGVRAAQVVNLGIDGACTTNVRALLAHDTARSTLASADVVILSIGGNDLYGDPLARLRAGLVPRYAQERTADKVERVVASIRAANPAARIYLLGLYNPYRRSSIAAWLDRQVNLWDARLIARFAANGAVTVVRIHDLLDRDDRISRIDGFHPGATGYAAIAARIAASL